jgi:integrase
MALPMPRPFATKSGSFYLNVKVKKALRDTARGRSLTLPIGDAHATVTVTDKVFVSLRTKDPETAKTRFRLAAHALDQYFDALAKGPQPLTRTQRTALVGNIYRDAVRDLDGDDSFLDAIEATNTEFDANVAHHLGTTPADATLDGIPARPADEKTAELLAAIDMYDPKALAAWALKYETDPAKRAVALEQLYGSLVDGEIARKQILVDEPSRSKTLEVMDQVAKAFGEMATRRLTSLDFADPFGAGLPAWNAPTPATPGHVASPRGVLTVEKLFAKWKEAHTASRSPSTMRRYGFSIDAMIAFWGERDVRLLTHEDIWEFARARQKTVPAATVNKNDLVAISSLLRWATTHLAGKLLASNPAEKVKLPEEKKTVTREKRFRDTEIAAILLAARRARFNDKMPRASASRRWAAWICAYTGCRIQETCWVTKDDIYRDGDVWLINFPKTKIDIARRVPLHPALIEEGLLAFHAQAPAGYLFCGDVPQKPGATRTQQEQRASELSEWIREQVALDPSLSPNHGWRHTFITRAEDAGITKRQSNAITGHNTAKDASDGYYAPSPAELKKIVDRYPRYDLDLKLDATEPLELDGVRASNTFDRTD